MLQLPKLISVAVTLWMGLFLTMDFVPAMSPVLAGFTGQATLYIKWDLENLLAGAGGCVASVESLNCFSSLLTMFWSVSGVPPRFGIIILGMTMALAIVHRQKRNPNTNCH